MRTGVWWENLEERDHPEESVDARIILKWTLKGTWWDTLDLINLAQERGRWRALLETVVNHRVVLQRGGFFDEPGD
jgi:hypothetical protein